jgi:GH15 family glucan-1,4-alpha-glucosidase
MHWLAGRKSKSEMPLQVLYRIDGGCETPVVERGDVCGYRCSRPVRFGNKAVSMFEIDSFGYLADCALIYLDHGGRWEPEFWDLIRRIADFTAANWHRRGSSIWEIAPEQHFVVGKVMSWVTLDRAVRIAGQTGQREPFIKTWEGAREQIHSEIMTRAWSGRLASFRQRYDADSVDAALLLIPIVGFLPVDHPRVSATIERIIQRLEVNGFLHRFIPKELPDQGTLPVGGEEGAFLMCSFWLAQVFVLRGQIEDAESILRRAEAAATALGLFAEAIDARNNTFLGNTPLLFSQVEYAKAVIALAEAQEKCVVSEKMQ